MQTLLIFLTPPLGAGGCKESVMILLNSLSVISTSIPWATTPAENSDNKPVS